VFDNILKTFVRFDNFFCFFFTEGWGVLAGIGMVLLEESAVLSFKIDEGKSIRKVENLCCLLKGELFIHGFFLPF